MRIRSKPAYSFDDVLLVPQHSKIISRGDVDLSTTLGSLKLTLPLISANMDSVTEANMAIAMGKAGGAGILHRFTDEDTTFGWAAQCKQAKVPIIISVGLDQLSWHWIWKIQHYLDVAPTVCLDVAHGDHTRVVKTIQEIKELWGYDIIAGNVATGAGALRLVEAGANIIKIGIGPGCHAAGTRILMASGAYTNIEDIVAGDRIINMNGQPATVKRSFSTGIRNIVAIRNSIWGDTTLVTPDHQYYVGDLETTSASTVSSKGYVAVLNQQSKTKPKQDKIKWKSIGDSDCALLMPRHIQFEMPNTFRIDISHRTEGITFLTPNYNVGYILGTFLGDGNTHHDDKNHTGSIHWCFGLHELKIAEKLTDAINTVFNRSCKIKQRDNVILVHFYHKPFADFLRGWGKRSEKHLPPDYLVIDQSYLRGLRDGLVDSDGHQEQSGRIKFSNTSCQLTELFGVITYLLDGIWPNVEYREPSIGGLQNCVLENCAPSRVSSILVSGEKRLLPRYQVSKLLEKCETGEAREVFDLEIDDPTHSFIANNAIVHNSVCSTRVVSGHGFPQLSAIEEVVQTLQLAGRQDDVSIIADGGIRYPGDIVKALAVGADAVMLGSLLAGTDEAAGERIIEHGVAYKTYRGMASREAQKEKRNGKAPRVEGVSAKVPYRGPVGDTLDNLEAGIRSGFSYSGASNLSELVNIAEFVVVTGNTLKESHPHHPYRL